jgi:transposase-like protein
VTDGYARLAAALQTIYPRVAHQQCWVHTLRNLPGAVRRCDQAAVKADAQAIYRAGWRRRAKPSLDDGATPIRHWSAGSFRICPGYSRSFSVPVR